MCEKGMDETLEHLMLECEKYQYARSKMLRGSGRRDRSEMRKRSVNRQMEYLLGLSAEWRSNSRALESVKEFLD